MQKPFEETGAGSDAGDPVDALRPDLLRDEFQRCEIRYGPRQVLVFLPPLFHASQYASPIAWKMAAVEGGGDVKRGSPDV